LQLGAEQLASYFDEALRRQAMAESDDDFDMDDILESITHPCCVIIHFCLFDEPTP